MSRGRVAAAWRPLVVWSVVSVGAVATAAGTVEAAQGLLRASAPLGPSDAVVAACWAPLAVAVAWLWTVTTATVVDLARGRVRTGGALRRAVLLACGAAVVIGAGSPARAGGGADTLAGLPMPDRPVAQVRGAPGGAEQPPAPPPARPAAHQQGGVHVVAAGDSLWAIAEAHPAPGTTTAARWRAIWEANRSLVGPDPDLIHPGQELELPGPPSQEGHRR